MKKLVSILLALVLVLSCTIPAFAAEVEMPTSVSESTVCVSETQGDVELLRRQIEEVNNYLEENVEAVDLEEQTVEYNIPLSDGSTAKYSLTLTQAPEARKTIFEAVLGTWYFKSNIDLPLHGSVTIQTTVNITHVPTEMYDVIRFTAYGGKVSAIPLQFTSITGSSATTKAIIETLHYDTTGYVGFDVAGVAANLYFTQSIAFVNNHDQNTKIQCVTNYTV